MLTFVVGMMVGAALTVLITGFVVVASEDWDKPGPKQKAADPWRWRMEDDGK